MTSWFKETELASNHVWIESRSIEFRPSTFLFIKKYLPFAEDRVAEWSAMLTVMCGVPSSIPAEIDNKNFFFRGIKSFKLTFWIKFHKI